jgi:hypothetical protein
MIIFFIQQSEEYSKKMQIQPRCLCSSAGQVRGERGGAERLADDGPESDGQDAGRPGGEGCLQHLGCGR